MRVRVLRRQLTPTIHGIAPCRDLTMREYHEIADETMDQLTDTLEALQEELADDDFDVEYSVSLCFHVIVL